jgi:Domain of unknown function (DUF4333)
VSRGVRAPLVLPALVCGLAACSVSLGTSSLSAETVAKGAEAALEKQVGQRPDVSCPKDVEAKVGAQIRCTLTAEGLSGKYGVTVKITSVEGNKANFDVKVDSGPQG